jgi:hypothetical protein
LNRRAYTFKKRIRIVQKHPKPGEHSAVPVPVEPVGGIRALKLIGENVMDWKGVSGKSCSDK